MPRCELAHVPKEPPLHTPICIALCCPILREIHTAYPAPDAMPLRPQPCMPPYASPAMLLCTPPALSPACCPAPPCACTPLLATPLSRQSLPPLLHAIQTPRTPLPPAGQSSLPRPPGTAGQTTESEPADTRGSSTGRMETQLGEKTTEPRKSLATQGMGIHVFHC